MELTNDSYFLQVITAAPVRLPNHTTIYQPSNEPDKSSLSRPVRLDSLQGGKQSQGQNRSIQTPCANKQGFCSVKKSSYSMQVCMYCRTHKLFVPGQNAMYPCCLSFAFLTEHAIRSLLNLLMETSFNTTLQKPRRARFNTLATHTEWPCHAPCTGLSSTHGQHKPMRFVHVLEYAIQSSYREAGLPLGFNACLI